MGNQVIHLSEAHHQWLKAKAKERRVSMGKLLELLIDAGMTLDQSQINPAAPGVRVRRGYKRAGER